MIFFLLTSRKSHLSLIDLDHVFDSVSTDGADHVAGLGLEALAAVQAEALVTTRVKHYFFLV